MIEYRIPPKPGEVTLDVDKVYELLYLRGHTDHREALLAGAGFAIGSILSKECETIDDATAIAGELMDQAMKTFEDHTQAPNFVEPMRFASILHYGIEHGRITTTEA